MKEKERDTPLHDELRQILKERRFRAGLTQRQLADRLGWDHKVISNLERGSKRLTVLELVSIARALEFDAASVVRRIERKGGEGGTE
jgi:transcriptional regulator with XRE-family HTH domain